MKKIYLSLFIAFVFGTTYGQIIGENIETVLTENYINENWTNSFLQENTYDENDYIVHLITKTWDIPSNSWQNFTQGDLTNNSEGVFQQGFYQLWSTESNSWNDFQRSTFTYNGSNDLITSFVEVYVDGVWGNSSNQEYTYDENGYLIHFLYQIWNTTSNSWYDFQQNLYTNNTDGTVQEDIYLLWDFSSNSLNNFLKKTYTYNTENQIDTIINESYSNDSWYISTREIYTYDENGYLINKLAETFSDSSWVNNSQTNYTNNEDGTLHQSVSQFWNLGSNSWNNSQRTTYTYISVNTLAISAQLSNPISCVNAADGSITATASEGTAPLQYSIDGDVFQDSPIFDGLAAGSYTITVRDSEGFTRESNEIVLENPSAITANATTNEFLVTIDAVGGTGELTYSLAGGDFQPTNEFLVDQNGNYTITIMDENGCTVQTTAEVSVNTLALINTELVQIDCELYALTLTGVGGTTPYQYSIDGENFQDDASFEVIGNDETITIAIQDAEGFVLQQNLVVPAPVLPIAEANVVGNDVTIIASQGTPSYQYSIDGEDFQNDNVFFDVENGDYTATVLDGAGCTSTVDFNINEVSIFSVHNNLHFDVHPNPSTGIINISVNQHAEKELLLNIYSVNGKLLFEENLRKNGDYFDHTINLQHLPNGIYNIRLQSGQFVGHKRLVVIR